MVFTAQATRALFVRTSGDQLWMGRVGASWRREGGAALIDTGKKSAEGQQWAAGEDATDWSRFFRGAGLDGEGAMAAE